MQDSGLTGDYSPRQVGLLYPRSTQKALVKLAFIMGLRVRPARQGRARA